LSEIWRDDGSEGLKRRIINTDYLGNLAVQKELSEASEFDLTSSNFTSNSG
jgi:hypothetical protein